MICTPFNESKRVVCRPEEALDCYLRTKMDVSAMGDWVVARVFSLDGDELTLVDFTPCSQLSKPK